jgi:hypothetical protein
MTVDRWDRLDEASRVPWLAETLKILTAGDPASAVRANSTPAAENEPEEQARGCERSNNLPSLPLFLDLWLAFEPRGEPGRAMPTLDRPRRDLVDELTDWPTISELACQLFGHQVFSRDTLTRLENWLKIKRPQGDVFGMPLADVAWMLRDAVDGMRLVARASSGEATTPTHTAPSDQPIAVQQLISDLDECRRRLAELRGRQDYVALTCAILRLEGPGGTVLYDQPFARILGGRPFCEDMSVSYGDTFAFAFYPKEPGVAVSQIRSTVARVDAITRELHPLIARLPRHVEEHLRVPECGNWWRILFHLGWHFSRVFLRPIRRRLLARDGALYGPSDETFVQINGMGGSSDFLPGLIYSTLEHDLCTCSEAAVGVIIDALKRHSQQETRIISDEQRQTFDRIRAEFLAGTQLPQSSLECKLLKLADSFRTPPAREWASLEMGGTAEHWPTLSRLNDQQEIAQIRGPATRWFCELAERAGNSLPACIPDYPILFDDIERGIGGPHPVIKRRPLERWIGFVFHTLKRHGKEALRIWWGTPLGPVSYGFATLDLDLCAASALAIDLARLTTAAEEQARREREACSPFSVPSIEEQGFQRRDDGLPPPEPPANYTLGQLSTYLRQFGEGYFQSIESVQGKHSAVQRYSRLEIGAIASQARESLLRIPGFSELRELARSLWNEEIGFAICRQLVDTLVQRSNGILSIDAAERLTLTEAAARLAGPAEMNSSSTSDDGRVIVKATYTVGNDNETDRAQPLTRHSTDFRSVHWYGIDYQFTPTQAACVKVLWEAWINGTPDVGQETILDKAGSQCSRLDHLFRKSGKMHPAWSRLIISRSKGSYRLADQGSK